jgi:hypothetical protein
VTPENKSDAEVSCVRVYMALLEPKRARKESDTILSRKSPMAKRGSLHCLRDQSRQIALSAGGVSGPGMMLDGETGILMPAVAMTRGRPENLKAPWIKAMN